MAWSYKKDVREVDREYQQLMDEGWRPVENADGKTYSWVRGNEVYRGKNDPTPGIDADANALDWFKRGRRQRRLMSEKVTAKLPLVREQKKKSDNTTPGGPTPGGPTPGGPAAGGPAAGGPAAGDITTPSVPFIMPDTRGLVPAEEIDPDQYQMLPFEGPYVNPKDLNINVPQVDEEVPYYDPENPNYESKYVYVDWDTDRGAGRAVLGGRTSQEIANQEIAGLSLPFGLDNQVNPAGFPVVQSNASYPKYNGSKVLRLNPDYNEGYFDTKEEAVEASKVFGKGEKASGTITEKTVNGKKYYVLDRPFMQDVGLGAGRLASATADVMANVALAKGVLGAGKWAYKGATKYGGKAIQGGKKLISKFRPSKAAQAAEEVVAKGADDVAKAATNTAPAAGASQAAATATNAATSAASEAATARAAALAAKRAAEIEAGAQRAAGMTITPKGSPTQLLGYSAQPAPVAPARVPVKPKLKLGPKGKGFGPKGKASPQGTGPSRQGFAPGEGTKTAAETAKSPATIAKKEADAAARKAARTAEREKPKPKLRAKNRSTRKKGGK